MFGQPGDRQRGMFGSLYQAKGGDDALRNRYETLLEVAQERELVKDDSSFIPEGFKRAGATLLDLLSRPNYAVAGMVDTALGNSEEGEYVAERAIRELFSGIGGLKGDKEFFGDVLEQAGVGEGGRLSDLTPDGKLETIATIGGRFDPTLRGTVGLGLDIALDPLTHITKPFNFAAKVMTEGGEVLTLSKKGRAAFGDMLEAEVGGWRKKLGLSDDLAPDEVIAEISRSKQFREANEQLARTFTGNPALDELRTTVRLEEAAATRLARGGTEGLLQQRGLQFSPFGVVNVPIKVDRLAEQAMGSAWRQLRRAAEGSERFQPILRDADETFRKLDRLVKRVPWAARKLDGYDRLQAERWMMGNAAGLTAVHVAADVVGQLPEKLRKNEDLWIDLYRSIEKEGIPGQAALERWVARAGQEGLDDPWAMVHRMRNHFTAMAGREQRAGLLGETRFLGRYVPRMADVDMETFDPIAGAFRKKGEFRGGDVRGFAKERKLATFGEFIGELEKRGVRDKLVTDPFELVRRRTSVHQQAMIDQDFTHRVLEKLGPANAPAVRRVREALARVAAKDLSEGEARIVGDLLASSPVYQGSVSAARAALRDQIRREMRANPAFQVLLESEAKLAGAGREAAELKEKAAVKLATMRRSQGQAWAANTAEVRRILRLDRGAQDLVDLRDLLRKDRQLAAQTRNRFVQMQKQYEAAADAIRAAKKDAVPPSLETMVANQRAKVDEILAELRNVEKLKAGQVDDAVARIDELVDMHARFDRELDRLNAVKEFTGESLDKARAQYEAAALARDAARDRKSDLLRVYRDARKATKPPTQRARQAKLLSQFEKLRPEVRARVARELLDRVRTPGELADVMQTFKAGFDKIPAGAWRQMANPADIPLKYAGQRFVLHKFTRGNLAGQEWAVPDGVAQDFALMKGGWQENPEVGSLLKMFDYGTNTFKLGVTSYFPAFNIRNTYSNVWSSFVDIGLQAGNPLAISDALKVLMGREGTMVTHKGRRLPLSAIRNEVRGMGFLDDRTSFIEYVGRKNALDILGSKKIGAPGKYVQKAAGDIEVGAKVLHYMALRRRGYTVGDAARHVNEFLFDYHDLSPFERNVMRRIIPFYTWQRKNIERQYKNLMERPGRLAVQAKLFAGDRGPEADLLPEYLRGSLMVGLEDGFLTNIDLPISSIDQLWAGGVGKTLRENLNMVNPLIKMPLELALDIDTFTGRNIKGRAWLGRMGPSLERNLPKWAKEYLELESVELASGDVAYKANGARLYLLMKGLFLGRWVREGVNVEQFATEIGRGNTADGAAALLRFLTGLQLRDVDMSARDEAVMRSRISKLEDILVDSGAMVEFRRKYIPRPRTEETGRITGPFSGGAGSTGTSIFGGQ